MALCHISAKSVAEALFCMISRVGIPKEILTDQGTAFTSRTVRKLYKFMAIKFVRTSVYLSQTDWQVDRFNRTLKTLIRKFVHEDAKIGTNGWNPFCSLCVMVPQASTVFSPFKLLYGREPHGVLDVVRKAESPQANLVLFLPRYELCYSVVFEVCVWIIVRLEDPNMALYKIYNRVSHLLIFFICWYLIESMMPCI